MAWRKYLELGHPLKHPTLDNLLANFSELISLYDVLKPAEAPIVTMLSL